MKGSVKWFSKNKGYGFIVGEDEKEYFVHWKSVTGDGFKTLVQNEEVEFEAKETDKGLQAENVKRLNSLKNF
ncbi:MAG: cold shock domain-containing protein [Candidatus Cloacimonetes bacterium]|nr:cold shock domain-containing protein [Candidatus Cloacimonadota bacterium]MBS3766728.1 cold shock domain-containing protein [Candidatus Cloacimonadota bacterium]